MINPIDDFIHIDAENHKIKLFLRKWVPEHNENYKNVVLFIVHGMAEHIARYGDYAQYMAQKGYVVWGIDLRGHGNSGENGNELGYLCDQGGFDTLSEDIHHITNKIQEEYCNHKIIVLAHSMGSLIIRRYIQIYPGEVEALILSGTTSGKGFIGKIGIIIAKLIILFKGRKYESSFLDKMTFYGYNRRILKPKSKFDWLTKDEATVEKYVNDPKCGFIFKTGAFLDLFEGIDRIHRKSIVNKQKQDYEMSILLIAGTEDPVGNYGKGPKTVYDLYKNLGHKSIELKLFEGDRHEVLNETNKTEVYEYILNWIDGLNKSVVEG